MNSFNNFRIPRQSRLRTSRLSKPKSRATNWDAPQGVGEQRTEMYGQYFEGAAEPATPWSAQSSNGATGSVRRQVTAIRDSRGMASLVITVVLISLLSAMAVAFAVIMNRELQKSLNNQIGQAAYNAAASGINDSISYLRDNPNTNVTQCQDLLGPGKPLSLSSDLSGDGSTKYTCVLINTQPPSLVYQTTPANGSQVIQASLSGPASKFMFSWQASSRAYNNFIPPVEGGQLFDETYWKSHKYAPMLKVSLYPVPADTKDASFASANSRTYYLYPVGPTGFSVNTMSYDTPAGTLKPVECGLKNNNGQFNGNGDFDCNLIITNLPSSNPAGYIYYIRLTPLYTAADVEIRANDGTPASGEVNFISTQAIIDVTAQSASAVKRLQARVDISGLNGTSQNISASDNGFPEYALRSANTICKRLQNPSSIDFPVYLDDYTINYCSSDLGGLTKLKPPTVTFDCSPSGQTSGNCSGQVDPKNGKITECTITPAGDSRTCPTSSTPSSTPFDISWSSNSLSTGTDYSITACAKNPAGPPVCATDTFKTDSPPPTDPGGGGSADPFLINFSQPSPTDCSTRYGFSHPNNCFDYSGNYLASCDVYLNGSSGPLLTINQGITGGSFTLGDGPAGSGKIVCGTASCNLGEACPLPPAPTPTGNINITSFLVQGPYDNGPAKNGNFCPEVFAVHRYVVCMTWSSNSSSAGDVYCTAYFTGPNGTSNSNPRLPNDGWTVGSDNDRDLIGSGSSQLICRGYNPSSTADVFANPNGITNQAGGQDSNHAPSCGSAPCWGPYFYTTPNCINAGAIVTSKCR